MWRKIRYNSSIARQKSAGGWETLSIHNDTVLGFVMLTERLPYAGRALVRFGCMEAADCVACRDDCHPVATTGLAFGAS
jgi:hypothetical protein